MALDEQLELDLGAQARKDQMVTTYSFHDDGHHGHYGFTWCDHCHKTINDKDMYENKECPKCHYTFVSSGRMRGEAVYK